MGRHQSPIEIDTSKCGPCSGLICIGVCPQGVLEEGKNHKPQAIAVVECTKCGVCVNLCPTKAISLNVGSSKK